MTQSVGWHKLKKFVAGRKTTDWIVWLGLAGIALIFFSSFLPLKEQTATPQGQAQQAVATQYERELEHRLTELVGSIQGVGQIKIMVTIEKSAEKVFATERKDNTDKKEDYLGEALQTVQQRVDNEVRYILVDGPSGKKEALLTAELEPEIKGVVIVCEGANDPRVVIEVVQAVTTALQISSGRVCVAPLGK